MDRARTITLVMAHNAAFRGFYLQPGSRTSKLRPGSTYVDGANDALVYLESLFPTQIGELCFIDRSGSENARVVHGQRGPRLRPLARRGEQPVLRPHLRAAARPGLPVTALRLARHARLGDRQRHADPAGRAAPLGGDRPLRAVRRELPARAARRRRRERAAPGRRAHRRAWSSTARALRRSARRSACPATAASPPWRDAASSKGVTKIDGHVAAYRHLRAGDGNANDWILVATAPDAAPGLPRRHRPGAARHPGRGPGAHDARRAVAARIAPRARGRRDERQPDRAAQPPPAHGRSRGPRGPAPPTRRCCSSSTSTASRTTTTPSATSPATRCSRAWARRSSAASGAHGRAYRLGGDEFCVLADAGARAQVELAAPAALAEHGDGFAVTASYGAVAIPQEAPGRERGAAHRRPAHVRAEELRPRHGPPPEHRRAAARPRRAPSRPRGPSRRRGPPRRRRRPPARPRGRGARTCPRGRRAARRGQGRHPRRDPQQARPAGRRRVGLHAPSHPHRRAHRRRRARSRRRRQAGARQPRALGRRRLPRRARRARTSRSARASSPSATPTTRSSPTARTAAGAAPPRRWPSCTAAPARSSTRRWWRPSPRCSRPTGDAGAAVGRLARAQLARRARTPSPPPRRGSRPRACRCVSFRPSA